MLVKKHMECKILIVFYVELLVMHSRALGYGKYYVFVGGKPTPNKL